VSEREAKEWDDLVRRGDLRLAEAEAADRKAALIAVTKERDEAVARALRSEAAHHSLIDEGIGRRTPLASPSPSWAATTAMRRSRRAPAR
jgi:hypothetical protein